jgi:hypothetical protein
MVLLCTGNLDIKKKHKLNCNKKNENYNIILSDNIKIKIKEYNQNVLKNSIINNITNNDLNKYINNSQQ